MDTCSARRVPEDVLDAYVGLPSDAAQPVDIP